MNGISRLLIYVGICALVAGLGLQIFEKWFNFGHLPGDIYIKNGAFRFYFPIVSCAIISLILSLLLSLFGRR